MIWVILKFHKILEIINKLDSNSISYNLNDIIYIISSTMWIKVIKWINDYKRAREAIIHYFSDIKFLKFKDIEENGGFLKQLNDGTIQRKIQESAQKEQDLFDSGMEQWWEHHSPIIIIRGFPPAVR